MNWEFTIQSPAWVLWVFVLTLIVLIGGPILLYLWSMRKYYYVLGTPMEKRSYGPIRIRPFLDKVELKIKDGPNLGLLIRNPTEDLKLAEGFRFGDGGRMRKVKILQRFIIVSEDGTEEYYFRLQKRKGAKL